MGSLHLGLSATRPCSRFRWQQPDNPWDMGAAMSGGPRLPVKQGWNAQITILINTVHQSGSSSVDFEYLAGLTDKDRTILSTSPSIRPA